MGKENKDAAVRKSIEKNIKHDNTLDELTKSKKDPDGVEPEDRELVAGTSGNSPTNEQPSASQNNQWEQEHHQNPESITGQQGSEGYEDDSQVERKDGDSDDDKKKNKK